MEVKEYLSQVCILDEQIDADIRELEQLKKMSCTISSSIRKKNRGPSRDLEDSYVRQIRMEQIINDEIDDLVDLKDQIKAIINSMPDRNERLILQYRYLKGMTWKDIEKKMHVNDSTLQRWHNNALTHVVLPKSPIKITLVNFSNL